MSFVTVAERVHDECKCPEHDIELNHITATVHMEPDGGGEAFVYFGDWEEEWFFESVRDIEELKQKTWERFIARSTI